MEVREVIYQRPDGMIVRSLTAWSARRGPLGEWTVGDVAMENIDGAILYLGGLLSNDEFEALVERQRVRETPT